MNHKKLAGMENLFKHQLKTILLSDDQFLNCHELYVL